MSDSFSKCNSLKQVYLPKLSYTYSSLQYCFAGCSSLELVDFHLATAIPAIETSTFNGTNQTFKIVVPNALYTQWKTATNWSTYADQIVMAEPGVIFNATQENSTIQLTQVGNPTPVSLEYMTTGTWTPYTIGDTITLANVGDKVYIRATSGANNKFGTDASNYHQFLMTGEIEANYSINFLLNQNGTDSTLADNSYLFYKLFSGCSALTKAPELPATTLANHCYNSMFYGCTSLTTAPALPATTLADHCYDCMFFNCSSLTQAPELPATTLASNCYNNMFNGCTSLTSAPELLATTLANYCYAYMFATCRNLNTITLGYTGNFADAPTDAFRNWVTGVSSTGTFYYNGSDTTQGASAIPTGWTVLQIPRPELCFTAREANSTVSMAKSSSSAPTVSLEYSTDGDTWSPFVVGTTTVTLANIDDKMWVRATSTNNAMASSYNSNYNKFVMTGQIAASGNINSLLNGPDPDAVTKAPQYAYPNLFNGCSALVDAIDLMLPSTTASQNSYGHGMFMDCTNLVGGPTIMATNLLTGSYTAENMFNGCSSLASVKIYATGSSWNISNTDNWMSGVPSTGTFYYNGTYTGRGSSSIPTGWTITPFT